MFGQRTLFPLLNATSSPGSESGPMRSGLPDGKTSGRSGPDPAHANLSPRQARAAGLMTSGTYGPPGTGSSSSADLQSSLASRLQAALQKRGSTMYRLTWKVWAMPSGRLLSRLAASVRRTSTRASTPRGPRRTMPAMCVAVATDCSASCRAAPVPRRRAEAVGSVEDPHSPSAGVISGSWFRNRRARPEHSATSVRSNHRMLLRRLRPRAPRTPPPTVAP